MIFHSQDGKADIHPPPQNLHLKLKRNDQNVKMSRMLNTHPAMNFAGVSSKYNWPCDCLQGLGFRVLLIVNRICIGVRLGHKILA